MLDDTQTIDSLKGASTDEATFNAEESKKGFEAGINNGRNRDWSKKMRNATSDEQFIKVARESMSFRDRKKVDENNGKEEIIIEEVQDNADYMSRNIINSDEPVMLIEKKNQRLSVARDSNNRTVTFFGEVSDCPSPEDAIRKYVNESDLKEPGKVSLFNDTETALKNKGGWGETVLIGGEDFALEKAPLTVNKEGGIKGAAERLLAIDVGDEVISPIYYTFGKDEPLNFIVSAPKVDKIPSNQHPLNSRLNPLIKVMNAVNPQVQASGSK